MKNPDESFITADGGLKVLLTPSDVTWFNFLEFSRATNSLRGGWNSKTHWGKRGVLTLSGDFLKQWTENSLRKHSLPRPRTDLFMLDRSASEDRSDLERALNPVEHASENALNYALFRRGLGKLKPLEGIDVLGYEIPLAEESDGQLRVDLFGVSSGGAAIEIIELKKANNTGDSPLLALTEAICYALQTLRCKKHLLKDKKLEGQPNAFAQINLMLLAPASYWRYWGERDGLDRDGICKELQPIVKHVNDGITESGLGSKLALDMRELESIKQDRLQFGAKRGLASSK